MNTSNRKLAVLAAVLALAAPLSVAALDLGLSASARSFGSRDYARAGILPGLYARGGALIGVLPRLEIEPYLVVELAPEPFRGCFAGADATVPLMGSRDTSYFNVFLSAGYLRGFDLAGSGGGRNYLSLKLTPLAIGDVFYGRRDRLFSAGVLYEIEGRSLTFVFDILAFDFFKADRTSEQPRAAHSP
jgi:hypothetical protein